MLLTLIFAHLSVLVAANPFHKYPFVFLLDVGNEELEKTYSEQIRVSVPGGSVAIRYPAIGGGNIISHVRVSGVDFGTDLKASIVDGGPGYNYVVLVFKSNAEVPFDAVVTVNTMVDSVYNIPNVGTVVNDVHGNESEEDENNSAEDLSDTEVSNDFQNATNVQSSNAELMQSSSNVYRYVNNRPIDDEALSMVGDNDADVSDEDDDDDNDNSDEPSDEQIDNDEFEGANVQKDIHTQYPDDIEEENDQNVQVKGIDYDSNDDEDDIETNKEEYSANKYSNEPEIVDSNVYSKYETLQDHLNYRGNAYSQEEYQEGSRQDYPEDPLDYEDPEGPGPRYEDEQINNGEDKFRDSNNNNYIDSDDSYAVAY